MLLIIGYQTHITGDRAFCVVTTICAKILNDGLLRH